MALTDESNSNGFFMPVAPAYGGGGGGFGNGFGGDGWWILLLLLFAGGGFGFGGGFGGDGALYPWLNNSQNINDGFRDQMMQTGIMGLQNSITGGFGDIQNALCGGFAGVNASVNGAQNAITAQLYNNQIADLERSFASQTAQTAGMNNIASNLQNCCCENRANIADLKYTVATENCNDRQVISDGIRDLLAATQAQTQVILDKMCQDKIDAKNDTINQLRSELLYARG